MKKLNSLLVLIFLALPASLFAQTPDGFKAGYIVTADGTRLEGFIKESFKSKAAIVFLNAAGKKTTYGGNAVNEVGIDGSSYISYASDFFKVVSAGKKASLLQKVSDATGKVIYNGNEAAGISSGTEGRISDFFIKTNSQSGFTLVNKDNLNKVVVSVFGDCTALLGTAQAGQLQFTELEKIITRYNECN